MGGREREDGSLQVFLQHFVLFSLLLLLWFPCSHLQGLNVVPVDAISDDNLFGGTKELSASATAPNAAPGAPFLSNKEAGGVHVCERLWRGCSCRCGTPRYRCGR